MKSADIAATVAGVGVSASGLFGYTLQEWVYILTIATLSVNLIIKAYQLVKRCKK